MIDCCKGAVVQECRAMMFDARFGLVGTNKTCPRAEAC